MEVIVNQRHSVPKYTGNAQFHTWVRLLSIWKWWRIWARGGCAKCAILSAPPPSCSCSCCRHGAGVVEFHCMLQLCVQCATVCSWIQLNTSKRALHSTVHRVHTGTLDRILEWTAQCTYRHSAQLYVDRVGECMWPRARGAKAATLPLLHTDCLFHYWQFSLVSWSCDALHDASYFLEYPCCRMYFR